MSDTFELLDVSVAFETSDGIVPVLNHISLKIHKGDWIAVVGPNGSGKSTLGRVLVGLCGVSSGTVECTGVDSWKQAQIVFQNPDAQIIGQTVYEDVCFGLENHAVRASEIPARVEGALSLVGLEAYLHADVESLSGGQKQLLCIASALALRPSAIVFDEATAMLDPLSRGNILQVVQKLHALGTTIVWITQWMDELVHARKVIALRDGLLRFSGSPREFFYGTAATGCSEQGTSGATTPCEALGFPLPYTVQVANELRALGLPLDECPLSVADLSLAVKAL